MSKNNRVEIALLLLVSLASSLARPQSASVDKVPTSGSPDNTASIDLPFLQFKNGGIRVNFAGYHAEAGLGGLLGGSDAAGGLFASAGTPWGPSASAGLGGALGAADGTARGGLHARAGLGNGGPEAAAGLGGNLDGSARSGNRARGRLYAAASPGVRGALDESIGEPGRPGRIAYGKVAVKDVGNIQPIVPPAADEKVFLAKSGVKEPSTTLEFKLPVSNRNGAVSSSLVAGDIEDLKTESIVGGPNSALGVSDVRDVAEVVYPGRRYYRKLLRGRPVRMQTFYKYFGTNTGPIGEIPAVGSTISNQPDGIAARQANDNQTNPYVDKQPYGVPPKQKRTTLFDDIFNIPISTLAAVNQLLNNKAG